MAASAAGVSAASAAIADYGIGVDDFDEASVMLPHPEDVRGMGGIAGGGGGGGGGGRAANPAAAACAGFVRKYYQKIRDQALGIDESKM